MRLDKNCLAHTAVDRRREVDPAYDAGGRRMLRHGDEAVRACDQLASPDLFALADNGHRGRTNVLR